MEPKAICITLALCSLSLNGGCATMNQSAQKSWSDATRGKASRVLDGREAWLLGQIFGSTINARRIRLVYDALVGVGAPKTIKDSIFFPKDKNITDRTYSTSTDYAILLAHEATHIWQYQNVGLLYIADALFHQAKGYVEHGDRNVAYRYALNGNKPFKTYNSEQQGKIVEEYVALRAFGQAPQLCKNYDVLGAEGYLTAVEGMLRRDVNRAFVGLDPATARAIWSGQRPPR